MNTFLWIGSVGLLAALLTNLGLRLAFEDIFPPFFTAAWWSRHFFPYYVVWIVFLTIGVGQKFAGRGKGNASGVEGGVNECERGLNHEGTGRI